QVLHDMYLLSPNSTLYQPGTTYAHQGAMSRLLRRRHRKTSAKLTAVVGISHSILERFHQYRYFENVPHYVVHNARHIPEVRMARMRRQGEGLTVGFIGTLAEAKGLEWLISQFRGSGIDGSLRIAGKGKAEDVERFKQLTEGDSRIDFVGYYT